MCSFPAESWDRMGRAEFRVDLLRYRFAGGRGTVDPAGSKERLCAVENLAARRTQH